MATDRSTRIMLALCTAILVAAALYFARSIFAPLAFALFMMAIVWPLQNVAAEKAATVRSAAPHSDRYRRRHRRLCLHGGLGVQRGRRVGDQSRSPLPGALSRMDALAGRARNLGHRAAGRALRRDVADPSVSDDCRTPQQYGGLRRSRFHFHDAGAARNRRPATEICFVGQSGESPRAHASRQPRSPPSFANICSSARC